MLKLKIVCLQKQVDYSPSLTMKLGSVTAETERNTVF